MMQEHAMNCMLLIDNTEYKKNETLSITCNPRYIDTVIEFLTKKGYSCEKQVEKYHCNILINMSQIPERTTNV